jgi:putative transposase
VFLLWLSRRNSFKKNLPPSVDNKRGLIESDHPVLSVRRQCELIGLNRGTYYYEPAKETPLNLTLMRLIDEQLSGRRLRKKKNMKTPFYGSPDSIPEKPELLGQS